MGLPEFSIILLNLVIVLVAYLSVYPKLAGNSFSKIAFYDTFVSGFALLVVGIQYWNSGHEFTLFITNTHWFWFTFVTYGAIEIPIAIWYFKKKKVKCK